jgi:putative aldouronate transport system substrate-binding protein
LIDWNAYRDATERAYFADSDEEALKILEQFRQQLRDGGVTEYEEWVTQEMQKPEYADYIY